MEQNLSAYRIFYEVASCSNISKAAKKLYISQPAISKSIVKLEDNLETKLFKRNSRGVTLTEEGELLYGFVKEAFDAIQTAETELKRMREFHIGHIRIGASTTLCHYRLLPYLKRFMEHFPNIRVSIITHSSAHTLSLMEQGKLDIGLVAEPQNKHPELTVVNSQTIHDTFVSTPLYLEKLRALCGRERPLFSEGSFMLLDQDNLTRRHIDGYFKSIGVEPVQILEVSTMDLLIEFAKLGIGSSCVVREFVEKELEEGTLLELPLPKPIPTRSVGFVYNGNNPSKSLEAFLSIL